MPTIAQLLLQAALTWGPKYALQLAEIWKKGGMTDAEAVEALTVILLDIQSTTVDGEIAAAEARAAGNPIPVTGTVTLGPA